jgi:hypothetical protein
VDVARSQEAALQIAILIEHEQRMVTGAAEVAVIGRALLLAVGRALGAIHVEDNALGRPALVHPVDPGAGQVCQGLEIGITRQPLSLETPDLAAGRSQAIQPLTTNDRSHRGIAGQSLGVVDVLVAGQPAEHRLAE